MRLLFMIYFNVGQQLPPIALTFSGDTLYIFWKYTQAFGFHKRSKHKQLHKPPQKKPESFGIPIVVPKKINSLNDLLKQEGHFEYWIEASGESQCIEKPRYPPNLKDFSVHMNPS